MAPAPSRRHTVSSIPGWRDRVHGTPKPKASPTPSTPLANARSSANHTYGNDQRRCQPLQIRASSPRALPIHDLADGRGNLDHLLLGPAGVFVLDTKKREGTVCVDGDDLVVTNELDPTVSYREQGLLRAARGQAARLHDLVQERNGRAPWVQPIVVIWGTFPARVHLGKGVTVVHGRELVNWLRSQPHRGVDVLALAEHLQPGRHRRSSRAA